MADAILAHGYTLAQVHHMAKTSVNMAGAYASDYLDRLDAAYGAIIVHLYEAPHWPTRHQLQQAGATAVSRMVETDLRQRGYRRGNGYNGAGSAPRFAAYWNTHLVEPSPENRIVERVAVAQVLPCLFPRESQAIAALAATDDYQAAADLLGTRYSTFCENVTRARRRVAALWHEGETPRRLRTDVRVGSRAKGRATQCKRGHPYPPETTAERAHAARKRSPYCPACYREKKQAR
jgi:hypothetical protein